MQDFNKVPSLPGTLHPPPHNVAPHTNINTATVEQSVDNYNRYPNNSNHMIPTRQQRSYIPLPFPFRITKEPTRTPAPFPIHDLQNIPINLSPDGGDYDSSNGDSSDGLLSLLLLNESDDGFDVALKAATVASFRPSSNESSPCPYEGNNYAASETNNMMTVGDVYGIDSTPVFGMLPHDHQNQLSSTSQEVEDNRYHNYHNQYQML